MSSGLSSRCASSLLAVLFVVRPSCLQLSLSLLGARLALGSALPSSCGAAAMLAAVERIDDVDRSAHSAKDALPQHDDSAASTATGVALDDCAYDDTQRDTATSARRLAMIV